MKYMICDKFIYTTYINRNIGVKRNCGASWEIFGLSGKLEMDGYVDK